MVEYFSRVACTGACSWNRLRDPPTPGGGFACPSLAPNPRAKPQACSCSLGRPSAFDRLAPIPSLSTGAATGGATADQPLKAAHHLAPHGLGAPQASSGPVVIRLREWTLAAADHLRVSGRGGGRFGGRAHGAPVPHSFPSRAPIRPDTTGLNRIRQGWTEPGLSASASRIRLVQARGAYRNRTGVNGFAGRCVATPPRRRGRLA